MNSEVSQVPSVRTRLGVLVSGRGSNLQAMIDAIERGEVQAEIGLVISNHKGVLALERAERHCIKTAVFEWSDYGTRAKQQRAILECLRECKVDLLVLAGFDRVIGSEMLQAYEGRIINIHPSLLPSFGGGLHAQAEALAYGVKISGCTVHFVTEDVDSGPIIIQRSVPVMDDDTVDSLAARILAEEHKALPEAVRLVVEGKVRVDGRRAYIDDRK